ncbi:hypothetical protein [Nodularia sp. NIES-3585]|uniref:hypothetical protein n=1 Tax=Nodularia sp. NIES-3585 TaxID=1973477 RepID=UPI000B5CFE50|nr:hypothetical protein [Nodularia sp. NIES-3585]GAX35676.1 hypothetical protein NIES3585_16940 [Nodularia sp. NIES-3585]
MTSRADEIQKLIADIDNLLNSSGKRLSRLLSSQAPEAREVLEKIRNFLAQQRESEILSNKDQNKLTGEVQRSPLLERYVNQGNIQSIATPRQLSEQQNQPTTEQSNLLSEQLKSELSTLIQPLQAELAAMMQERATLVQEIRQLEQRKQHNSSLSQQWANQEQMISEFLQLLMSRIASNLVPQIAENVARYSSSVSTNNGNTEVTSSANQAFLESTEQAQRLTHLTKELDKRLLSLDGTVNFVFEALQRNINTYHESLCQGLARMHSTGVQGEQLMANFLNNLTQHLQQESPITLLSFPELEKNEPLSPLPSLPTQASTIEPEGIQANPNSDQTSQVWEFVEPEASSSLTLNDKADGIVTDDLDAMLLALGIDDSESSSNRARELQQDGSELIGDPVDQLYASLLGSDNFTKSLSNLPENIPASAIDGLESEVISTDNLPENIPASVIDGLESEAISTDNISETTSTPLIPPGQQISDPWSEEADTESDSWQELFFEEDAHPDKSLSFSGLSETTVALINSVPLPPSSADTITSLSELLGELGAEEQELGVSSAVEIATVITNSQQSSVVVDDEEQGYLNNYIPASPQENLLSPEESQSVNLPDITLDEAQMQQLNQDLANFDEMLNPDLNLDIFYAFEESVDQQILTDFDSPNFADSGVDLFQVNPISWPQPEADLDFSPTIEKTEKVTSAAIENSLITGSNSVNNLDANQNILDSVWYLGIDVGTTGISAALLNRSTAVVYPIYWSSETQKGVASFQQSFRLPAEVYLPTASVPQAETEKTEVPAAEIWQNNCYSVKLKPYLQVAIPYQNEQQKWQPVLQFNKFSAGPLIWVVRSLSKLLLTLKSDRQSTTQGLIATAVGLNEKTFHAIINHITGVICNCPSSWSEQYRFNVREAVLTSKLVPHPQQVFFVEEAIASLLSILDSADGETVQISDSQGLHPAKPSDNSLVSHTFVINIGATATEMALVDLPENLQQLAHNDFMLHSFAYASHAIEQDIICQLLFPPKYRQPRWENERDSTTITNNPWQWQPAFPGLDQTLWQSLGLEELDLPQVGEPDMTARIRLQQRLESSLLGQAVLNAAVALKLILQNQDSFTLELADQRWVLQRRDLENHVFVPFVRRLNREFNKLLVARGIPTEAINQAILTGGVASLGLVNNWLQQKLPNTKIIQDLYLGENGAPVCSRVAYGLAMLPLHPQVLEAPKQQYTDYFLFMELLRLLPDRTLSFSEILQLFEDCGINTSICQQRLLAFLSGELPPGLIPATPDSTWLTSSSQNNSDYQAIAAAPLFVKQGNLTFRPNFPQVLVLRRYLDAIKASTQQPMDEPYTVDFAVAVTP